MTTEQKAKIATFRKQGYSYSEIGRKLDISRDTVKSFCRRNSLIPVVEVPTDEKGRCRECGKPLVQQEKQKQKRFCCKSCREKWWAEHPDKVHRKAIYPFVCASCGKKFTAYGNNHRKYCSHACYISHRFGGNANDRKAIAS